MPRIKKPKIKNQVIVVPTSQPVKKQSKIKTRFTGQEMKGTKKTKSASIKRNPIDYYACLTSMAQAGFPNKISACCRECKQNAPALNVKRQQELQQ
jgi:hypothetical protein